MNTGKETLSEDIIKQILNDEKLCNEILNEYSKDPKMQEKLNNHCCISIPSNIVLPLNFTN